MRTPLLTSESGRGVSGSLRSATLFVVIPMLHIGRESFFREVHRRLRDCDVIVVEGVAGVRTRVITLAYRIAGRLRRGGLVTQSDSVRLTGLRGEVVRPARSWRSMTSPRRKRKRPKMKGCTPLWLRLEINGWSPNFSNSTSGIATTPRRGWLAFPGARPTSGPLLLRSSGWVSNPYGGLGHCDVACDASSPGRSRHRLRGARVNVEDPDAVRALRHDFRDSPSEIGVIGEDRENHLFCGVVRTGSPQAAPRDASAVKRGAKAVEQFDRRPLSRCEVTQPIWRPAGEIKVVLVRHAQTIDAVALRGEVGDTGRRAETRRCSLAAGIAFCQI